MTRRVIALGFLAGMLVACTPDQTLQDDRDRLSTPGTGQGALPVQAAAVSPPGQFMPPALDHQRGHEARNLLEQIQASYANGGGLTREQLKQMQGLEPVNALRFGHTAAPLVFPPAASAAVLGEVASDGIHASIFWGRSGRIACQYARNDPVALQQVLDMPAYLQVEAE
ncbi:MAG: hypothetical protein KDI44_08615 [Thiothrix sp.]|nr:hypothetical protein [Thiothrix sp.]HPQ96028.1 hypothetical protein [Thiolinea sp.]